MASINGDVIAMKIATDLDTPVYKTIICAENAGVDGNSDVTKKKTKCGVKKSRGAADWTISGTGIYDDDPESTEISAQDMVELFQPGTEVLVELVYSTGYLRRGQGFIAKYSEKANTGDLLMFDYSIEIIGDLTVS